MATAPIYTVCAGWKDYSSPCGAPALVGDTLCRHHQYQHSYTEGERQDAAAAMIQDRKFRQRQALEKLKRQKVSNRKALMTKKCHSCDVYRVTRWDPVDCYWRCKRH